MRVDLTAKDLIAFEEEISNLFLEKKIRSPVHLMSGAEEQLIGIFREHVEPEDWICGTWRFHIHCLLKGVPPLELKQAILDGRSISLCFPEHRIISSAIAGGIAPIAAGLALGIKRKGEETRLFWREMTMPGGALYKEVATAKTGRKVVCFVGDMAAEMGIVQEAQRYCIGHGLPIIWVVENNGKSVNTDTVRVWGGASRLEHPSIIRYEYKNKWPHVGCGQFVQF